jgi:hypothetical protein
VYGPSQPHPFAMNKDREGKRFDTATTATTSPGNTLRGATRRSGPDGGGTATATRGMCGETLATLYLVSGLTKVSPVKSHRFLEVDRFGGRRIPRRGRSRTRTPSRALYLSKTRWVVSGGPRCWERRLVG